MVIKLVSRCARKGVDPHPKSHTAAALDRQGKVLGHCTVENTAKGLVTLADWLKGYEVERCAVEGANNPFARALSQGLLGRGYKLIDVSPSLTSQYRFKRGRAKSDLIDAENIAKADLANAKLTPFEPQPKLEELKALTRTREALVKQLTAHRLSLQSTEVEAVREALDAVVTVLKAQIGVLEERMKTLVNELMPELLTVSGVGVVHAATLLAKAGDVRRFRSQHAFAMFCGCAPVERSSGGCSRRQLNIGGNRRLNRTFHVTGALAPP